MNNGRYDIVVIGGGSAGCVIAARLSANPEITVAVLEAGGTPSSPTDQSVVAWPTLLGGPTDWCYSTVPQAGLGNRVLTYARGKALGGSSTINAMAHLRGHKLDYDAWASAGAAGWAYADVLPWFRRSEDAPGRDTALRGIGGPMQAVTPSTRHPVAAAGLAAVSELGYPLSDDLSGNHQEGGTWLELNVVDGRRQTAFDAYLKPVLDRPNLTVIANAQVRSLIVTNGRCTGAEYVHDGELQQLSGAEIVLSAGSIGSPALLMLSGIGSAVDLERVGVPVVLDSPNVGRNLQDHPLSGVVYTSKSELPPGANNHSDAVAALRRSPAVIQPDFQLLFLDVPFFQPSLPGPAAGYTVGVALLQPKSRGSVRLASPDPDVPPLIDPAFLTDQSDLAGMVDGLRLARQLGESEAFESLRSAEALPGKAADDDQSLRQYAHLGTGTYFHPIGTCRLGAAEDDVVDLKLRVRGIDGLRVVDASVMPSIVSANPHATVLAIAERAADWIAKS